MKTMNTTLRYVILAFIAGMVYAAYRTLTPLASEKLNNLFSTKVDLRGTMCMLPLEKGGYIKEGGYISEDHFLALQTPGRHYMLVFKEESDLSALSQPNGDTTNRAIIGGKTIHFNPSKPYIVSGRMSSYTGFKPIPEKDLPPDLRGRGGEFSLKDESTEYYKIVVYKILPIGDTIKEHIQAQENSKSKEVTQAQSQCLTYSESGISFEYPSNWRSFPSQAVSGRKASMTSLLRKYNRTLISLAMFTSSDEDVALFVSKVRADNPLSDNDILSERRKFYDDATRAGDVTKINKLETTTFKDLPAVVEDVERGNGGRGHTVKLLKGRFIIEISLIVNNKADYDKHVGEYEQILATLKVEE